ncbi:hypothetical protein MPLA_160077 [Mesorhizobium sp. ORS 3359]|nr:hypothetical protein MPLA_160077 [Mesorhizobium sp. ORS 3359]
MRTYGSASPIAVPAGNVALSSVALKPGDGMTMSWPGRQRTAASRHGFPKRTPQPLGIDPI